MLCRGLTARLLIVFGLFVCFLFFPMSVAADPARLEVAAGGGVTSFKGVKDGDLVGMKYGTSSGSPTCFCCSVISETRNVSAWFEKVGLSSSSTDWISNVHDLPTTLQGQADPVIPNGRPESRQCFCEYTDMGYTMVLPIRASSSEDVETFDAKVECTETCLYGGFNTASSEINFLELYHMQMGARDFEIRFEGQDVAHINASNEPTSFGGGYIVPPLVRKDIPLHGYVQKGAFGTIKVCHDGPPGAIRASVSSYKILSQEPLDFILTERQELKAK